MTGGGSDRAAGVDRPDVDQRVALDHVVDVVEVDLRVAVGSEARPRGADREVAGGVGELDPAVLVAEDVVLASSQAALATSVLTKSSPLNSSGSPVTLARA